MMTSREIQEKAVEALIAMIAALTNIRLYPSTSAIVAKSVEKIHPCFQEIFRTQESLVYAESEKDLLIEEQQVDEKDRKKPQVDSFLNLMLNLGIRSITFRRGIDESELTDFLKLISRKPEEIENEGGIRKKMEHHHMPHIQLDKKVYVAVSRDDKAPVGAASADVMQDKVLQFLTSDNPELGIDREAAEKIASDPERIAKVFSAGMQQMSKQKEEMSRKKMSEKFGQMIRKMGDISGQDEGTPASTDAAAAISQMKGDLLGTVLSDNLEHVLENGLLGQVIQQVDDEKFKRLAAKFRFMQEKVEAGGGKPDSVDHEAVVRAYRLLMSSDRAKALEMGIQERYDLEHAQRKNQAIRLKTGLTSIMKGQRYSFMDDQVMQSLPDTVEKLYAKGKPQTAEQIISKLSSGLTDTDPDICEAAAKVLSVIHEEIHPLNGEVFSELKRFRGENDGSGMPVADKAPQMSDVSATGTASDDEPAADLSEHINHADRLVDKADNEGAVGYLAKIIGQLAEKKRFSDAKSLREKLIEINPMALTEIIRTGEIIENEESGAIDTDFLDVWAHLNQTLSPEEINTLYYALRELAVGADHTIFRQGDLNTALVFVTQGQLKLTCRQGDRDLLLATLEPGDIGGADTFFEYTVCTTSLISLSTAKLNILDREVLDRWDKEAPSLAAKIRDWCIGKEQTSDLLKQKGLDRRGCIRVEVKGAIATQILSGKSKPVGKPFKGNLADISIGGLSFFIKTQKTETARLLLGRMLHLQFTLPGKEPPSPLKKKGTVIGVKLHPHSDCSVHVKFTEPLRNAVIDDLKGESRE